MSTNPAEERLRGVFSIQEVRKIGTGTTTRKTVAKTFWYVDHGGSSDEIEIQSLNSNYVPTGSKKTVTRAELLSKYAPELEFYVQTVYPKMKEMSESIDAGDGHREKGDLFSAEFEYDNALAFDEESVRANFGIGLTYLAQGENDKADNILMRLAKLEATFSPEHKHLFNEFGINLRKNKLYEKALDFYNKALEMGRKDDHLYINIARVQLEIGQYPESLKTIKEILTIDEKSEMAEKMLTWLTNKKHISPRDAANVQAEAKAIRREASV